MTDRRPKYVCEWCGRSVRRLALHQRHFHDVAIAATTCPHGIRLDRPQNYCQPCQGGIRRG